MKPTYDNVFVIATEQKKETASGIILTTDTDTGMKPALVVAVGPEVEPEYLNQTVFLSWNDTVPVTYQGQLGALTSVKNIMAVI